MIIASTEGCSVPFGWQAMPLSKRAEMTPNIIYGNCTNVYEDFGSQMLTYEFDILCVLKGGPFPRQQLINITDSKYDCTVSGVKSGLDYILFVQKVQNTTGPRVYKVDEVNVQSAAQEPTEQNFQIISRVVRDFNNTYCAGGVGGKAVKVSCFNSDVDNQSCSGGVAAKLYAMLMVLPLLLTAFIR